MFFERAFDNYQVIFRIHSTGMKYFCVNLHHRLPVKEEFECSLLSYRSNHLDLKHVWRKPATVARRSPACYLQVRHSVVWQISRVVKEAHNVNVPFQRGALLPETAVFLVSPWTVITTKYFAVHFRRPTSGKPLPFIAGLVTCLLVSVQQITKNSDLAGNAETDLGVRANVV